MKHQTWGVEIEMTGITRYQAAEAVAKVLNTEVGDIGDPPYCKQKQYGLDGRAWTIERDASIRAETPNGQETYDQAYKVEFVTPICTWDDIPTLQEMVRALRKAGARINNSCGIHVHVGADGHTGKTLTNLTRLMAKYEPALYEALGTDTDRVQKWCKPVDEQFRSKVITFKGERTVEAVKMMWYNGFPWRAREHYDSSRYHALNLHSVWQKARDGHLGTVEFRLFNSTLHAGKVRAYLTLALAMNHYAKTANRITNENRAPTNAKAMRHLLFTTGLTGDENATVRKHLMAHWGREEAA